MMTDDQKLERIGAGGWFPIVGIGASAGGLDACETLLAALPPDTGMAFVIIQHLHPQHASMMGDLLASRTRMAVTQATQNILIEPNRIYLIPPGVSLAVSSGHLHLSMRLDSPTVFDFFLQSLAEDCGNRAVCVVLSGSGSDGPEGLKAVKANGGFVVVQDPSEAAFDGMPNSAIRTKLVDLVLPAAEIPGALIQNVTRAHAQTLMVQRSEREHTEIRFSQILDLVKAKTRHDFSPYKTGTITRRIERRMAMSGVTDIAGYVDLLRTDTAELDSLAHDLLINVTQFFRDEATFEALRENVIPEMIAARAPDQPLRIWVPGCSTGEEVYSLTMLLKEAIAAAKCNIKLQVFASDVDAQSVSFARAGLYSREIDAQISPERLARFFFEEEHGYRVTRDLRETIVFTVQDLLRDPPFSRLDLISCRNVLIYLLAGAQKQILSLFHFALRPGGVLVLGRSESARQHNDCFEPIDKKQRIYRNISVRRPGDIEVPVMGLSTAHPRLPYLASRKLLPRTSSEELVRKLLIDAYAPASILINTKYEGLYYSGPVDRYVQVASGEANRNLLVMARDGLRPNLSAALERARDTGELTSKSNVQFLRDGTMHSVEIVVRPVPDGYFLVSFVEEVLHAPTAAEAGLSPEDASRVSQLEQEVEATRRELNATIRDHELANEDLRAVNEEVLSINEEFQSTNEELETSKEELQALNEELTVLNTQLQESLEQQRATSADLQNILHSSDVATLFLDAGLSIRFFTPAARSLFGVTSVDIGRPLADLAQRFQDEALLPDASAVLDNHLPIRREIKSQDGNWYIRGVLPYRGENGTIEGVVITFARISELKAAEQRIEAAKAYAERIIATIKLPLLVLDECMCVVSASASFFNLFDVTVEECVGKPFVLGAQHDMDVLAEFLAPAGAPVEDRELTIDVPGQGLRDFLLTAREIVDEAPQSRKILISLDDVTEAKARSENLAAAKNEAERANLAKSRFLAAASHDLRQPLQTIALLKGMLLGAASGVGTAKLVDQLDKTVRSMSGLLDKLLNINQLEAGILVPRLTTFPIDNLLKQLQSEFEIHAHNEGLRLRVVRCGLRVRSDPRLLEQIIRNMLSNATKYTSEGKVLLGCRRRGDRVRIEVCDTGTGIPETELSAIFNEFHQLDNRVSRRPRGLGLGLAIVKGLADLLGARITVRSLLGRGSAFGIEVPLAETLPPVAADEEDADLTQSGSIERMRPADEHTILVIEDELEVRDTLKMLLESHGYRTFAARDRTHALVDAEKCGGKLDLILADYNLPGPNGLEVVAEIEKAVGRSIPTIMLTGDISAGTLLEIAGKGNLHLYKPADAQELLSHIERLIEGRGVKELSSTVFVIDDDDEAVAAIRAILEMHGYRTEVFNDGSAFLKAYSPDQIGCLIADARVPGMGAFPLIERLQEMRSALPVIAIAAFGGIALATRAIKAGAFDFLEKPLDPEELLSCVERALREAGQHAQLSKERVAAAAKVEALIAEAKIEPAERRILDLFLIGAENKTIAADLKISEQAVNERLDAIVTKVGAESFSTLIRVAFAASTLRDSKLHPE